MLWPWTESVRSAEAAGSGDTQPAEMPEPGALQQDRPALRRDGDGAILVRYALREH